MTRPYTSNSMDDVGGLTFAKSLERAFALSMGSLYNLPSIVLSYPEFTSC